MKFGIIHYQAPGNTMEEFLDYVAETGFDVVELQCNDIWPEGEEQPERRAEQVRGLLDQRGVGASALSTGNDFVLLDEQLVAQQIERMERLSRLACIVGARVLRTEGGSRKDDVPADRESEAIAECLKRCVDFAERDDTYLAVDNHGYVSNDPNVLVPALKAVGSPRIGTNLDTANYRWSGQSVEACRDIYDAVAPFAVHTHMKDCIGTQESGYRGTVLGQGEVDVVHALAALKRAGYKGPYIAEWEGGKDEDKGACYAECLAWLRQNVSE